MNIFENLPIGKDDFLKLLNIELSEEQKRIIDTAFQKDDDNKIFAAVVLLSIGWGIKKRFDRIVAAIEAIPKELKEQTLEMEVTRGAVQSISDAIREHTVDQNHTVR